MRRAVKSVTKTVPFIVYVCVSMCFNSRPYIAVYVIGQITGASRAANDVPANGVDSSSSSSSQRTCNATNASVDRSISADARPANLTGVCAPETALRSDSIEITDCRRASGLHDQPPTG